ncbi:MAG: LPS export ABC transporter permease LptF, partial [Hydrocarboniphaga effusa]|nr:LPS export ABC transporter permease LptF [Hydrocarboniphaga effusa]
GPVLGMAAAVSALTAALSFQIGPWAGRQADYLVKDAQRLIQFTPFEPGVFREVADGRAVFYTAGMDETSDKLETVFALLREEHGSSVITAQHGVQERDAQSGDRIVKLEQGYRYAGTPGQADYDIVHFETLSTRIAPPAVLYTTSRRKIQETGKLLDSEDLQDQAELQWRIAAPVSVLLLALLAVPLSYASPREGRYGKLVLGLVVYLFYTNLLAAGQAWIANGYMPAAVGLWWVHALFLALGLWLIARRMGWVVPWTLAAARHGRRRKP